MSGVIDHANATLKMDARLLSSLDLEAGVVGGLDDDDVRHEVRAERQRQRVVLQVRRRRATLTGTSVDGGATSNTREYP